MARTITPVASGRITLQLWLGVRDTPITTKELCFEQVETRHFRALLRAYRVKEFKSNSLVDFYPGFPFVVEAQAIAVPRQAPSRAPLELRCWFEVVEIEGERLRVQSSLRVLGHTTGLQAKLKSRFKRKSFQLITLPRVIHVARPTLAAALPSSQAPDLSGEEEDCDPDELDIKPLRG